MFVHATDFLVGLYSEGAYFWWWFGLGGNFAHQNGYILYMHGYILYIHGYILGTFREGRVV